MSNALAKSTERELQQDLVQSEQTQMAVHQSDSAALMSVIEAVARDKDFDPSRLRELLQIKREFEAEESRRSYAKSMATAQSKIFPVVADADNRQTGSRYALLSTVVAAIAPIYTRHGFSVSFGTTDPTNPKLLEAGYIRFTGRCLHSDGHHEDYSVDLPADIAGAQGKVNKTVIHGTKSSLSYARGILLGLMFNFTTSLDVDDDGNGAGRPPNPDNEPASEEQLAYIKEFESENKIPEDKLKWLNSRRKNLTVSDAKRLLVYLRKLEKANAA